MGLPLFLSDANTVCGAVVRQCWSRTWQNQSSARVGTVIEPTILPGPAGSDRRMVGKGGHPQPSLVRRGATPTNTWRIPTSIPAAVVASEGALRNSQFARPWAFGQFQAGPSKASRARGGKTSQPGGTWPSRCRIAAGRGHRGSTSRPVADGPTGQAVGGFPGTTSPVPQSLWQCGWFFVPPGRATDSGCCLD